MKIKHYLMVALMLCMGMVACDGLEDENVEPTPKVFKAHFNLAGEISFEQEPLTRFTPDTCDLYAIQVYYKPVSGGSYDYYAYGLFDDVSNISLDLIENHYYKFEFVLVDDAKEKIYCDSVLVDNKNYYGYGAPFTAINKYNASKNESITKVTNEFEYSSDKYFTKLGLIQKTDGLVYGRTTGVSAYYAEVDGFCPTAEGEVISVYFKKMACGLRVVAGDFLTEGTLSMTCRDEIKNSKYQIQLTPENKEVEAEFALLWYASDWYKATTASECRGVQETISDIVWTKADGTTYKYDNIKVYYKRMTMTTVNIAFYDDDTLEGVSFDVKYEEDADLEEGNTYTHGDEQGDYVW
ncbi:MAG: hypothetical protein IKY82_03365 [Alistipes sp.]|nr:hypothetical protein [Alistipes sp.]